MRGAAQVAGLGERRTISESSTRQDVSHIIRNRTKRAFQRMLNHNDTIRIERVIEGANWQHSKNGFLKSAPHHTFLVSYESGCTYDSISQKTTLIHAEMTEIRMTQVTPQNHTRARKSARVQGWLKTTISICETHALIGRENSTLLMLYMILKLSVDAAEELRTIPWAF